MFFCTAFPAAAAAVSMIMDLRTARVDNGWILFSMTAGFLGRLMEKGFSGFWGSMAGCLLPLILLGWLFPLHMIGAGDIKLLCALGVTLGGTAVVKCIFVSILIGACISLFLMISQGCFVRRFRYFAEYTEELLQTGRVGPYSRKEISSEETFHFTVPVFMSVLLYAGGAY